MDHLEWRSLVFFACVPYVTISKFISVQHYMHIYCCSHYPYWITEWVDRGCFIVTKLIVCSALKMHYYAAIHANLWLQLSLIQAYISCAIVECREVEAFARRLNSDWPERMHFASLGQERKLVPTSNGNGSLHRYSSMFLYPSTRLTLSCYKYRMHLHLFCFDLSFLLF